jgi:hypothetical protein
MILHKYFLYEKNSVKLMIADLKSTYGFTMKRHLFSNLLFLHLFLYSFAHSENEGIEEPSTMRTVHLTSTQDIFDIYKMHTEEYPHHISFATAQAEQFIAYELIAREVYKVFHAPSNGTTHLIFLRYPEEKAPKSIVDLFSTFPVREDYDTISSVVQKFVISASPSLKENEEDESALAIFIKNDREEGIKDFISEIFIKEGIPVDIFKRPIRSLLKKVPLSHEGGIITRIFIPESAPLDKVLYRSVAYGKPYSVKDIGKVEAIRQFFRDYTEGKKWEDDPNPQLRFLLSGLSEENGFELRQVHAIRYTLIPNKELQSYIKKVHHVVSKIFQEYQQQTLELENQKSLILKLDNENEKNLGYAELVHRYLKRFDPLSAWLWMQKMTDKEIQARCLAPVLAVLLQKNELEITENILQQSDDFPDKTKILAILAMAYLNSGQLSKVKDTLEKMSDSPQKNFVILMLVNQSEEDANFREQLSPSFSTNLEELIAEKIISI